MSRNELLLAALIGAALMTYAAFCRTLLAAPNLTVVSKNAALPAMTSPVEIL